MHNARAAALIQLGRDEEALDSIRKALEVRPRAAHNLRILAAVFANLGRMQEARDAVAQVLQIAPAMTVAGVARIYHADTPGIRRNLEALRRAGLPAGDQ